MNPKKLIPLVLILVVLAVLVVVKKTSTKPPTIVEQANLAQLTPESLAKTDLAKIELYMGAKPEAKTVLTREETGDAWRVTTHFNVPAQAKRVDEYLDALVNVKGEFRASADTDEQLNEYELGDSQAFHVLAYKKDGTEPLLHLLVGKSPDYKTVFVRKADDKQVFVEPTNLRSKAGLYGGDQNTEPDQSYWLEKNAVDLDKDKIQRVELTTPDKHLVLEKKAKPAPPAEDKSESEGEGEGEAAEEPPAPVEYEWALAEGGPGLALKQTGVDALLRKLDVVNANNIVDPARKSEWGLDAPAFKCVVRVEGQEEDVVIEGSRPDTSKPGYIRVANAKDDICYELRANDFESLWPKGSTLFDLPALTLKPADLNQIELALPEGRVVLARKGEEWVVSEPKADLKSQKTTLDAVASGFAAWKAVDYADSPDGKGLDAPTRKGVAKAAAETHTLTLGADSTCIDGVYARLDENPIVCVMSRADVRKIFPTLSDLFERTLFELTPETVSSVHVERGPDSFGITRAGETWNLTVGGETSEADAIGVNAMLNALSGLQAKTILFGKASLEGTPFAAVRIATTDGKSSTLTIGAEKDDAYPAKLAGKETVFTLSKEDVQQLTDASLVRKPEGGSAPVPAEPDMNAPDERGQSTEITIAPPGE